jgi:acyl-CoA synthetase (AMP-forming)/AMP-acid ligase II
VERGAVANLPSHHATHAARYRQLAYWSADVVPDALSSAARDNPAKVALVDRDSSLTYAELGRIVRRLAAGLHASGVRKGDVVAIQLPNWKEFVYFQQAVAKIGAIYIPLIPQLRAREIESILRASKAVAAVVPANYRGFDHVAMLEALRPNLPALRDIYAVGGPAPTGAIAIDAFLEREWERESGAAVDEIVVWPDEVRALFFTSGTEANPKGVLHSYNTLAYPLRIHARDFGLASNDAVFVCSPVGHATGCVFGVELGLFIGGKIVLKDTWNPVEAIELIARERCTMMWGATTFFSDLVNAAERSPGDLSCLRLMCSGGAPIPRELVTQVRDRIGGQLAAAYGSSEGMNVTINRLDDPPEKITGSDGRFNPGIDYKLVDEARNPQPRGSAGEIAYRGPNVCLGYLDPDQTAGSFDAEGFFYSGDLGVVDGDGYLRIVGRKKEIIIRGGENISPAEIENLLYRHPKISAVAVLGFPDKRLGESACAAVIPKPGETVTLDDITQFLRDQGVAKFKFPERLEIVTELPRTPTGKLRRNVLRDEMLRKSQCSP